MGRELDIKLDFLPEGKYLATIVQDGADAHFHKNRETLRTEKREVTSKDVLCVKLAPGGGARVIIEK
jgi:alpha-glucosidase